MKSFYIYDIQQVYQTDEDPKFEKGDRGERKKRINKRESGKERREKNT